MKLKTYIEEYKMKLTLRDLIDEMDEILQSESELLAEGFKIDEVHRDMVRDLEALLNLFYKHLEDQDNGKISKKGSQGHKG